MYQVSSDLRTALNGQRLQVRITPDGSDAITADDVLSLTYTAASCAGETIGIGNVCSAMVVVKLAGKRDLQDQQILVEVGTEVSGTVQYIPLGRFQVSKPETQEDATTITAYDAIYYALGGTYIPADPAPTTALGVLRDICTQAGLELAETAAPEDAALVDEAIVDEAVVCGGISDVSISGSTDGLTCREIAGKMAALLGSNVIIGRDGKLQMVWFESSGVTLTADDYYSGGLSLDGPITLAGICVTKNTKTTETDEDGITTESETPETLEAGNGSGTVIGLENDYFTQSIVDAVWAEIGGLGTYRTGSCSFINGLLTEPGDLVQVQERDGAVSVLPVMSVQLELDGGCKCTISANGQSSTVDSANSQGPMAQAMKRFQADIAEFKQLYAENLTVTKAKITNLYADSAWVEKLFAQDITATGTIRGVKLIGATGEIGSWTIRETGLSATRDMDGNTYQYVLQAPSDTANYANVLYVRHRASEEDDWTIDFVLDYDGAVRLQNLTAYNNIRCDGDASFGNMLDVRSRLRCSAGSIAIGNAVPGVIATSDGNVYLQNAGTALLAFYPDGGTTAKKISVSSDGFSLNANTAVSGDLSSTGSITSEKGIISGGWLSSSIPCDTQQFRLNCIWADGTSRAILTRDTSGLVSSLGWDGSDDYSTRLDLRSRTVRVVDSSGTTTLSDERMKKDWKGLQDYDAFFDALNPQAFRYIDGSSGRYHLGFGAQSVEQALADGGLDNNDFGGLIKYSVDLQSEDWRGYDEEYGLIYSEFVALLVEQVQKLKAKVADLEQQNAAQENQLTALERRLTVLEGGDNV